MTIVFFSNFINHHQVGVADELYRLTDGNYYFVCTQEMPESFRKVGYPDYSSRPYAIKAYNGKESYEFALHLAETADVAIFGGNDEIQLFRDVRLKKGLLSFECGERWLKKGILNLLSPRLIKSQWHYHTKYYKASNYYALCMSGYASEDYRLLRSFKDKCYKWAYFTKVDDLDLDGKIFIGNRIMWCNRFIDWKHPEMPILLARRLKDAGYSFVIDMFGSGAMVEKINKLSESLEVKDCVNIKGNLPNELIREEMYRHDILLTTSDKNEGWGATVNEGMSNGCVLIGSNEVGSVKFLINDEVNGLIFKSNDLSSLFDKVTSVINKPEKCNLLAKNAYITMKEIWSPENGARKLLTLINCLMNNNPIEFSEGPCSKC